MGCDIYMYLEYKDPKRERVWWNGWPRINPARDYLLFGKLAGVREPDHQMFAPRGLPTESNYYSQDDAYIFIDKEESENYCTLADAKRWGRPIIERDGKPVKTLHPDWHSHSWLTLDEFSQALEKKVKGQTYSHDPEYFALQAAAKVLESAGNEVRFVFWFDN
jgi:hypothetical protein